MLFFPIPAVFQLNLKTKFQAADIYQTVKSYLDSQFYGIIGIQIVRPVAQENSSSKGFLHLEIYSIGHRNTTDILSLIRSRIQEGMLDTIELDPKLSNITLITTKMNGYFFNFY